MIAASALFADMAKDTAMSKTKSTAKETVVKQVAGNTPVRQETVKKASNKVTPKAGVVTDKVMGSTNTSIEKGKTTNISNVSYGQGNDSGSGSVGNVSYGQGNDSGSGNQYRQENAGKKVPQKAIKPLSN